MTKRLLLVHWHQAEAEARAECLREAGWFVDVHWRQDDGATLTRSLAAEPPAAVILDLARLPSHGRAIATWLRERRALRAVPLVFVPGDPAKTERARAAFPDAVFVSWSELAKALPRAIASAPRDPVVPRAPDYSGTPLAQKLGIVAGARCCFRRAPEDFPGLLGELPEGVRTGSRMAGSLHVVVVFCRSVVELQQDLPKAIEHLADGGKLWVAWPKRTSGVATDLNEDRIRAHGLELGVVDTKVCAIDATWSGLRFSRRRAAAGKRR